MFRISFIIIISLLFSSIQYAQEIDVVQLTDNRSYKGKVVEQKPGEYIKLVVLNTTDTLTFSMDEIEKLMRIPDPQSETNNTELEEHEQDGFNQNRMSLFLQGGTGGGDVAFQALGAGLTYRQSDKLSLGVVAQYLGESSRSIPRSYQWQKIPVALRATYDLQPHFSGRSAIYSRLDVGYSFTINGEYVDPDSGIDHEVSDGFLLNPAIGYRVNLFDNTGLTIDVGYLMITDKVKDVNGNEIKRNSWDNFILTATLFF